MIYLIIILIGNANKVKYKVEKVKYGKIKILRVVYFVFFIYL